MRESFLWRNRCKNEFKRITRHILPHANPLKGDIQTLVLLHPFAEFNPGRAQTAAAQSRQHSSPPAFERQDAAMRFIPDDGSSTHLETRVTGFWLASQQILHPTYT